MATTSERLDDRTVGETGARETRGGVAAQLISNDASDAFFAMAIATWEDEGGAIVSGAREMRS